MTNQCELCYDRLEQGIDEYFEEVNSDRALCSKCMEIMEEFNRKMEIREIFFGDESKVVRR